MLNLLRMNLFRMIHTKGVVIVFVLLMSFSFMSACMYAYDSEEMSKNIEAISSEQQTDEDSGYDEDNGEEPSEDSMAYDAGFEIGQKTGESVGIYVDTPANPDGGMADYLLYYCEEVSGGILLLFIIIGAVLFFNGEDKCGFIKNIAGQTKHKYDIYFAKIIAIGIYTLVCMICYMIFEFTLLNIKPLMDVDIDFGMKYLAEAAKVFAIQYLLHMAFISGLLMLITFTKSTAVSITIGILAIMGFGSVPAGWFMRFLNTDLDISKYYINSSISKIAIGADNDAIKLAIIVGLVFLVVYNVINVLWFTKRDIV